MKCIIDIQKDLIDQVSKEAIDTEAFSAADRDGLLKINDKLKASLVASNINRKYTETIISPFYDDPGNFYTIEPSDNLVNKYLASYTSLAKGETTPLSNDEFKSRLLKYLQGQGIVDKKQFPAGSGNYYIKKTQLGQDPKRYSPEETERLNLSKIADINEKYGSPIITTRQVGNGLVVDINTQLSLFDKSVEEVIEDNPPVTQGDIDYINENILTENTGQLVENVYLVAEMLNNKNILGIASINYRYQGLLTDTKTEIMDDAAWVELVSDDEDIIAGRTTPNEIGGLYDAATNTIHLNRTFLNSYPVEKVLSVINEEIFHALTVQPLWKQDFNLPMTQIEKTFASNIKEMFDYYKSKSPYKGAYRFSNTREFLVAMIHDKEFKDYLKELDKEQPGFFKKLIDDFVRAILKFLGIRTNKPITDFEVLTTGYLNQYLENITEIRQLVLPDENLFSQARDVNFEKERLRTKIQELSDDYKESIKEKINNFLNYIKSISNKDLNKYDADIKSSAIYIMNQAAQLNKGDIDQIDYVFSFTNEIVRIFTTLSSKVIDLQNNKEAKDDDKLKVWNRIISTARDYDIIIGELASIRSDIGEDDQFSEQIRDIINSRAQIESGYSNAVVRILAPMISEIQSPATQKALAIYDQEIDHLKRVIAITTNERRKAMHQKELAKKIKERDDKYNIDAKKAEAWLRGHMGDSNLYTSWIEAAIVNPNILVSGLAKFTKDKIAEINPEVLNTQNQSQTEIEAYSKATGISVNNIEKFYEPLIEKYKVVSGVDDKGDITEQEKYTLLSPWNRSYIGELKRFTITGGQLNIKLREENLTPEQRTEVEQAIEKNREDRAQFIKDYMERPYKDEVHDALDLYHKDLGGFTAASEFRQLYDEVRALENEISITVDQDQFDRLSDILQEKEFEIKRLRSTYEKDPNSKEYKIAELMSERDKKMNQYFEYVLSNTGRAKFEHEKAIIDQSFNEGKITETQKNFWYQRHTNNALSDTYWSTKMGLIGQMNDILGEMGATQEKDKDLGKLYIELRDITKPFRDMEGIIDGNKFTQKQVGDIKQIEEKIEELKDKLPNLFGLSKSERIELSNAYDRLDSIDEQLQSYQNPADKQALRTEEAEIKSRIDELSSKKKQFKDKKLLDKYFQLLKKLGELDISGVTHYYQERYEEELAAHADNQSTDDMKNKFSDETITYEKISDVWYARRPREGAKEVDEPAVKRAYQFKKARATFENSDWYKQNHIQRTRWSKNEAYDPGNAFSTPGSWEEVNDPLYIWKQSTPADPSFVLKNEPSIRYKVRKIKTGLDGGPDYSNRNYRKGVDGYNLPRIEGAKDNRYINKKYFQLEASQDPKDKATFKFLKYLTDLYFKSQENYPISARPGYDLPSVRKSKEERRQASTIGEHARGWVDKLSQYFRAAKDEVSSNEQDKDILYGYIDNIGGMIPAKLVGDIDIEDQSVDLMRSIGMFYVASLQRRQLIEAYPFARALLDVVSDKENTPAKKGKDGAIKTIARRFLKRGTEAAKHIEGESQVATQINEIIKTMYFGERIKDQPGAKQINAVLGVGAKLMLGFNIGSMVQNYANAKIQSLLETEAAIGKNFTIKDWVKAEVIFNRNIGNVYKDLAKYGNKSYIGQFVDYFGGLNFNILTRFDDTLAYKKLRESLGSALMPTEIAEKQLSTTLFVSMGLNTKVNQTIDGVTKKIPLYEAFEINKEGNFVTKEGVEFTKEQKEDFMARLNNSARRINGEYGKLDTITAQKTIAGRLVLFMDKFFVPFFMNRFGKRRFNTNEGIQDDGFWRLFFNRMYKDLRNYQFNVVKNWAYYNSSERAAVKKTMTEISVSITIMALIAALGGGNDTDDINNNSTFANNVIYILKGIKRQNEQFMLVPGLGLDDIAQRIKNPLPIATKLIQSLQVIQDLAYLTGYTMGLTEGKDIFYTKSVGWHRKGDLKVMSTIGRLLGSPNKLQQLLHPDVALKNLNSYRIR